MLIAVIPVKDYYSARQQISMAFYNKADGVELRLDYLYSSELNFDLIADLISACNKFNLIKIFTLRKKSQGGEYKNNEEQRQQDLLFLCRLNPDYIDIEYDTPADFVQNIKLHYPNIKLICSYHNLQETPIELMTVFKSLQSSCFYSYKIATMASNTLDALRMLEFVNTVRLSQAKFILTGLCMGEDGISTRILSPIVGNAMNYASLDKDHRTAPGQLTLDELLTIYHIRDLNTSSKIYALLGDPVSSSVGHVLHNQAIRLLKENAVYIKLRATYDELPGIIERCRSLPFAGFSITMPLKEVIGSLVDKIEDSSLPIKAINSVVVEQGRFIGFNTDGIGAILALSEKVNISKQKIVILGAGGAARAIAYAAVQHQAQVIIVNRTLQRAKILSDELKCENYNFNSLDSLKKLQYTVIISTLPSSAYQQQGKRALLDHNNLLSNIFAMDIVYQPRITYFLQIAKSANCTCIFGYEMYIYQALMQIKRWFSPQDTQISKIKTIMNKYFLTLITR